MSTGYIFDFAGHGQFSPEGKVNPQVNIEEHNKMLDDLTVDAMKQGLPVTIYLTKDSEGYWVGTWAGGWKHAANLVKTSWHNMAGRDGRTDVWFTGPDGRTWHGVNIGDNQILRCKRNKK